MKFYQLIDKRDGKIHYDKDKLIHLTDNLFDGRYLVSCQRINPRVTIKDFRACYFAKIDGLAFEVGETRYGVHHIVKDIVLSRMLEELPDLFTEQLVSTRYLSLDGWGNFLERLDLWAYLEYGVILE